VFPINSFQKYEEHISLEPTEVRDMRSLHYTGGNFMKKRIPLRDSVTCANTGGNSLQNAFTLLCMRKRISLEQGYALPVLICVMTLVCMGKRITPTELRDVFSALIQATIHIGSIFLMRKHILYP
jgi:hypothetical protein